MSISCVAIDINNKLNLTKFVSYIKSVCGANVEIIYCSTKKVRCQSVKNYIFNKNENSEKIINAVIKKCTNDNILLIRDIDIYEKVENLIKNLKKTNQVIYYKKQQSKSKSFILKIINKTIGKFYMQQILPVDHSIALYGESAGKILKNVNYPSILCKTNNWQGINTIILEPTNANYKFAYNFKNTLILTIIPMLIATVMFILRHTIGFKMIASLEIGYWALVVLLIIIGIINASRWYIKSMIGENEKGIAEIIN